MADLVALTLDTHAKVDGGCPHAVGDSAVVLPFIPKGHRFYAVNTGVGEGLFTGRVRPRVRRSGLSQSRAIQLQLVSLFDGNHIWIRWH